jgi:hypothetical protein
MRILGGRPVIHHAMLWYATDNGYRTALVPVHQAGNAHSIWGNITVSMRCHAIYTGIPFSQYRRQRSNQSIDLLREAVVVACIFKVRDSSM